MGDAGSVHPIEEVLDRRPRAVPDPHDDVWAHRALEYDPVVRGGDVDQRVMLRHAARTSTNLIVSETRPKVEPRPLRVTCVDTNPSATGRPSRPSRGSTAEADLEVAEVTTPHVVASPHSTREEFWVVTPQVRPDKLQEVLFTGFAERTRPRAPDPGRDPRSHHRGSLTTHTSLRREITSRHRRAHAPAEGWRPRVVIGEAGAPDPPLSRVCPGSTGEVGPWT